MVGDLIDYIPEHLRVVESPGYQWGIWGGFFLVEACLIPFTPNEPPGSLDWVLAAASALVGACLAAYQVWRCRNPTILVKDGAQIAVFRKGDWIFRSIRRG